MRNKSAAAGRQGRKKKRWTRDDSELTFLALPTMVWYLLFSFLPMFGVIIAFKDFRIHGNFVQSVITSRWAGLKNFKYLFASKDTVTMLRNTLGYNIVFIVLGIVVPVILAVMINQLHSRRLGKVYQTAMFMPYFLSWVVVAVFVWAFLSYDKGVANQLLAASGHAPVNWYMEKKYWPGLLIFLQLWKSIGYGMVIYLASITNIDPTYYEAAVMDGATKWQQTKYITLPMMKTVIVIMFILNMGGIFRSDFGLFYQVPHDSNALFDVTYTIDVMVYKSLKSSTVGMASASALFQSVMGCAMVLATNAIVKRIDPDNAMI